MKRLIIFVVMFVLSTPSYSFEIAFSREKLSLTKYITSLSFLDPVTFEISNTTVLGEVSRWQNTTGFADDQEEFFYALVPKSDRKPWQMVVFSIRDQKEITRLNVGRYLAAKLGLESHYFRVSNDGQYFIAVSRHKRKEWRLDVYLRPLHELTWSTELPKGISGAIMLSNGILAVTTSREAGGKDSLSVIDVAEQKILKTHVFERGTKLVLLPSKSTDRFNLIVSIKTPIDIEINPHNPTYFDAVSLHKFDLNTGQAVEVVDLGFEPTLVYVDPMNDAGYFATRRSLRKKGLTLWSIQNSQVKMVMETDLRYAPTAVFVREGTDRATVLCGRRAVVLDIEKKDVSHDFELPMNAVSGFMNQAGNRLFFREEEGSEVGLMDVEQGKVIDDSPTGNRGEKFGRVLFNVAGVALVYYTGIGIWSLPIASETTMLTDKTERFLYVLNHTTNDVTIFKNEGFERLATISTKSPFQLAQYESSEYVFVLGYKELALIDPKTNELSKTYKDGEFAGISEKSGNAYFLDEDGLKIIDIVTGDVKHILVEPKEIYLVVSSKS